MIKPIDMQVIIPKANEVSKIEQNETLKHGQDQLKFSQQMDKQVELNNQQVSESQKSEKNKIEKDERNKNQHQNKKKKKKNNSKDKKDEKKQQNTGMFDVRI